MGKFKFDYPTVEEIEAEEVAEEAAEAAATGWVTMTDEEALAYLDSIAYDEDGEPYYKDDLP